jgi:ABC transporter substrate binding protein (PQQ-dependent alcohol dehydrogenase system)
MASVSRRAFLRFAVTSAIVGVAPHRAQGQATILVGLVRPPERRALGDGAALGFDDANALVTMFGRSLKLVTETATDAAAAGTTARALIRQGAIALVGGVGPHADALRDVAAAERRLFFNAGAPDDVLRGARCEGHSFHLVPSVSMSVDALTQWLAGPRKQRRWAMVSDGSPRGREIEAAVQRAAKSLGASLSEDAKAADITLLAVDSAAHRETAVRLRSAGTPFAGIGVDLGVDAGAGEAGGFGDRAEADR